MFACLSHVRKPIARLASVVFTGLFLVACDTVALDRIPSALGGGGGTVPVALLVPQSGGNNDPLVARSLENAARLAMAGLDGVEIDLRVYDTAGQPTGAASAANLAMQDGAAIILGPLYSQNTTAVIDVTRGRGINVLSFSNNTAVAGGNVFLLGQTYQNVANRLAQYAARQGKNSVVIVHANNVAGTSGRNAVQSAARGAGIQVAGTESYDLSQQAILEAGPRIAATVRSTGAQSIFLTGDISSDLPMLSTALNDAGVLPGTTQSLGLTDWSALPQALSLPGLQNGWIALPDRVAASTFAGRYQAAYGNQPHALAGLGFDGIAAIGALVRAQGANSLTASGLTQGAGFAGASGAFRFLPDGTNQRALAVAQVQNNQVVVIDPAPRRFGGAGF